MTRQAIPLVVQQITLKKPYESVDPPFFLQCHDGNSGFSGPVAVVVVLLLGGVVREYERDYDDLNTKTTGILDKKWLSFIHM